MNISTENKRLLVDEIKFVLQSMKESKSPIKSIYFFSGIYALLQRIFNTEYDPDLVFAHIIFKMVHDTFSQKILNPDPIIELNNEHFERLYQLSENFYKKIENNEGFDDILKCFAVLSYSVGGNGYYLAHKGILSV